MYEEMEPKDIKETGTETEEPRQTVRDYYADGTPVIRTNGTQPVYGQNAGRTEQTDPMPANTQSTQPQSSRMEVRCD